MNKIIGSCLLFALLLFGCIDLGGKPEANVTNVTKPPPPPPTPSFSISQPLSGAQILALDSTADVNIILTTKNLIIKPSGTTAKIGQGHFRASLDGGAYTSFFSKSYVLKGVSVGKHTLKIELVNNDKTPYSPAITKTVQFEVKKAAPKVYVPKNYTVEIKDFSYSPANITVKVGDSITWVNIGSFPRSATSTDNFDTKVIAPGGSATIKFINQGTFNYFALTHMVMKGAVKVEANTTG